MVKIPTKENDRRGMPVHRGARGKGGKPTALLTDNGQEFTSKKVQDLCRRTEIELRHDSPYNPTTQGCIERFNQTLMGKLRKLTDFGKKSWRKALDRATQAYNNSMNRAIGCTPNELRGKELETGVGRKYEVNAKLNVEELIARTRDRQEKYQKEYRDGAQPQPMKIGEKVRYNEPRLNPGKLEPRWNKEATIIERRFESYRIQEPDGKTIVTSASRVKLMQLQMQKGGVRQYN